MNVLKNTFPVEKRTIVLVNLENVCDIRKLEVNTNHVLTFQEITNMIVGAGLDPENYVWRRLENMEDIRALEQSF